MDVIHRRDVIRNVLHRYTNQYKHYADDQMVGSSVTLQSVGDTKRALAALNLDTCSVDDVVKAMNGTTGWASLECDECGRDMPKLLRIGDEPEYEARWRDVCEKCLGKALKTITETASVP